MKDFNKFYVNPVVGCSDNDKVLTISIDDDFDLTLKSESNVYVVFNAQAKILYRGDMCHCYLYSKIYRKYNGFWPEISSIECYNDMMKTITKNQKDPKSFCNYLDTINKDIDGWDAEKKELKKTYVIDEGKDEIDYCFTKMMKGEKVTPAWSEEDEEMLSMLLELVEFKEESMEAKVEFIAWLKSLKGRVQSQLKQEWKPSDELIQALERSTDYLHDYGKNDDDLLLLRLLEELKKLKEE